MEIYEFKLVLEDLASVGIKRAIFEPTEDGTLIRGANKDGRVVVFFESEFEFSDKTIAIQDVSSILSRVQLFDVNKTNVEMTPDNSDDHIMDIELKQGRRKTTFRCSSPDHVMVPKKVPGDIRITDENSIEVGSKYVDFISNAISSMSKTVSDNITKVGIEVVDHRMKLTITDEETDSFVDEVDGVAVENRERSFCDAPSFSLVLRRAIKSLEDEQPKEDKEEVRTKFTVTEDYGLMVFRVGTIDVIVAPSV